MRAFTLIEILIAVLILSLGLLGLGAVFPVVIRAQRISTDATYGVAASNSARAILGSLDYGSALSTGGPAGRAVWRDWRSNTSAQGLNRAEYEVGEWLVPVTNDTTNATTIGAGTSGFQLPVRERLYPYGSPHLAPPLFVWDLAVHRISDFDSTTNAISDPLEVVIFVRRIDPRIRVAAGFNLYRVLTGEGTPAPAAMDRRRPVGFSSATGLPTLDGTGVYARPRVAKVSYGEAPAGESPRNWLKLGTAETREAWTMMRQPGQKLVDNLGTVYTVTASMEQGATNKYLRVEPPVPAFVGGLSPNTISQVVYTPQVPASVELFRIEP